MDLDDTEYMRLLCIIEARERHASSILEVMNHAIKMHHNFLFDNEIEKGMIKLSEIERKIFSKDETFLVAIMNGNVVGSIHIYSNPREDTAHYGMIAVDTGASGVTCELIHAAKDFCRKMKKRLVSPTPTLSRTNWPFWWRMQYDDPSTVVEELHEEIKRDCRNIFNFVNNRSSLI